MMTHATRYASSAHRLILLVSSLLLTGALGACHQTKSDGTPAAVQASSSAEATGDEKTVAETMEAAEKRASDTLKRFSVPVLAGWSVKALDDEWIQMISPEGDLDVFVGVAPDTASEDAIENGWTKWGHDLSGATRTVSNPPASEGLEEVVVVTYEMDGGKKIAQSIARKYQGDTYVFSISGELAAIQKRQSQVVTMMTGLEISALQKTDLSEAEPVAFDAAKQAEFDAFIQRQFERSGIPGAAVAVVVGDKIVYQNGFGVRQKGKAEPVTPATLMMIGSATKSMTTTLMASLVDDGLMQWDSPVVQVMPEFKLASKDATKRAQMQHLVCACTGVPRRDLEMLFEFATASPQKTVKSLGNYELLTDFGETFQYSNQMVAAGGYAAAMANGAAFNDLQNGYATAMKARIFEPLGMTRTTLSLDIALADPNHAMPHDRGLDGVFKPRDVAAERFVEPLAPSGAVWSSVEEMARFLSVQIQDGLAPDGTRLVSAENLAETHRSRIDITATMSYGLGWFLDEYKGAAVIHHGGNTLGFTAGVAYMPRAKVGIIVLTNAYSANWFTKTLERRLWEMLYAQEDGMAEKSATTYLKESAERRAKNRASLEDVKREDVAKYLGTYTNADLGDIEFEYTDKKLVADFGEGKLSLMRVKERPDTFEGVGGGVDGPFQLIEKDGQRSIVVGRGAATYTLTPKK